MAQWISVCQWCGQRGVRTSTSGNNFPNSNPSVSGKCKSHPSGNQNSPHGPQWIKERD